MGSFMYRDVAALAASARSTDAEAGSFLQLIGLADRLSTQAAIRGERADQPRIAAGGD